MTVLAVPVRLMEELPAAKVEPAPDESQFPDTVHAPVVRVRVPLVPPVIETLETLTAEAFAVNAAPFPTVRAPPVRGSPLVRRVALPLRVRVPPHRSPFVAIVMVAAAVGLSCTLLNSLPARLPKV